jgi:hypothetical protein
MNWTTCEIDNITFKQSSNKLKNKKFGFLFQHNWREIIKKLILIFF